MVKLGKKNTANRKSLLYEAFQPILLSMTIIGLHYVLVKAQTIF